MAKLVSTNPAKNYEVLGEVDISTDKEIKEKVSFAHEAKVSWKELGVKKRAERMKPILVEFEKRKDEIRELITREMGKPVAQARAEVEDSLGEIRWYIENGPKILADEITYEDDLNTHKIVYEPYGVACVISPWNFPFEMFVWGAIPNLIAGNVVVFKISEECPLLGKLIEEIMKLPKGVFSEIYGGGKVGAKLAREEIDLLWFTGSSKVGKELYEVAAKKFIKPILELGGSSPGIIFEDADIKSAVMNVYDLRFGNCGQSCTALKRLIVHESIFDEVVEKLKKLIESKVIGNPENPNTDIGSLVAKRQLDLINKQVEDAIAKGAKIIGGVASGLRGAFCSPKLVIDVKPNMRIWKEEVFGPVLPIVSFKTEEEAIKLANDTPYGLSASVYTKGERALRVASKIDAGSVEINGESRWKPCNPFGGYKLSGQGREHGVAGFRELCQIKVVCE